MEKKEIPKIIKNSLDEEINNLQSVLIKRQQIYDDFKADVLCELNHKIKILEETSKQAIEKSNKNLFNKVLYYPKLIILTNKKSALTKNYEKVISTRCMESYKELDFTKEVVDGLYTLIAGAIGENSVVNELQKLPDNYYLINDFSVEFNPPIYNKKENDRTRIQL